MNLVETQLFRRLLELTPFSEKELTTLITTAPSRYKDHYIEKRNGRGKRLISQPTKELKFLQRLLLANELNDLPIHDAAVAYRQGFSIKAHAEPHASARYLLKLDFKDFFPSITSTAVAHCLERDRDYVETELWLLVRILCRHDRSSDCLRLSIGAPSSPFISNYMMWEFDTRLTEFCNARSVKYTRYADDLALSTSLPHTLDKIKQEVERLLVEFSYLGIRLNSEKTVNVSNKNRRTLVGLTLSNEGDVSVGRDHKRILRAQLHRASLGRLSQQEIGTLRGKLAFLLGVDPSFVNDICARYGFSKVADINFPFKS